MESKDEEQNYTRVFKTDKGLDYWIKRSNISDSIKANVLASDVIILPMEGFRSNKDLLFPEDIDQFYNYLKDNSNGKLNVEICINDEGYKEIELHDSIISLGTMLINKIVIPIFTSLVASYLYNKYNNKGKFDIEEEQKRIRLNLIIKNDTNLLEFNYLGSIDNLERSLETTLKSIDEGTLSVSEKENGNLDANNIIQTSGPQKIASKVEPKKNLMKKNKKNNKRKGFSRRWM